MAASFTDGILAGYGIAIPVGAIAVLIVATGMRCGFACAASAGAGAATADLVYAAVAATAGTAVARLLEPWSGTIRVVSAAVLVVLAVHGLVLARRATAEEVGTVPMRRGELALTYGRFLGLTIINPLTVVYFGTMVLGSAAGTSRSILGAAMFTVGAFAASLSWQTLLAGVGALARRGLSPRFRLLTAVAGNLIILALAVRILI